METRISHAERGFKQQLKLWEQQQLIRTGMVAMMKDMLADPSVKSLLDKLKHCKALAKEWQKEKYLSDA
jgi:hypothetical protein